MCAIYIVSADLLLNSYTDCILIYYSYHSWTVQQIAQKFSEHVPYYDWFCTIYFVFAYLLLNSWTDWTQNLLWLLLLNHSMDLTEFKVFYLECLIVPYLFSYYRTAPIQLNQLNSNLLELLLLNCSIKWAENFRVY